MCLIYWVPALSSIDQAKELMLPRDEIKREWRVPEIEGVADVNIDNSGTLDDLYRNADQMIEEYCPELLIQ